MQDLGEKRIYEALSLMGEYLREEDLGPYRLVIGGGAALIARSLVSRTTKDVDIVALLDDDGKLISPDPLPKELLSVAETVQHTLDLKDEWLNNGPSREPGGLFQLGLPDGLVERLSRRDFGTRLTAFFLDRCDHIHLKLYASVDAGPGRHVDDLLELNPTGEELAAASKWAIRQDPSGEFRIMLISMLENLGFHDVAQRIQ